MNSLTFHAAIPIISNSILPTLVPIYLNQKIGLVEMKMNHGKQL
jgi:hypothetical protein